MLVRDTLCLGGTLEKNEDCVGYGDNYIFVVDGATGLIPVQVMEGFKSDAEWFAKSVFENLKRELIDCEKPIEQILQNAMIEIKEEFDKECRKKALVEIDYPSAGICIFRDLGDYIEGFRLGDVLGVVKKKDDEIVLIQEKRLVELDQIAIDEQVLIAKNQKITVKEARKHVNETLLKHRNMMNKPDGYFILEPTGAAIEKAEYMVINKEEIESVSCMSDGYFCVVDTYSVVSDYSKLHELFDSGKAKELFDQMCVKQEEDSEFEKYPRFKMRDDASAVFAKI